ncbi:MAG: SAM-dependent methyltransferase [Thermoguttaceae bacterium]|nr:SAM-dependent methyltransferase [Thermoguttaceae bacterium]
MKIECLICKAPLEYLIEDILMECTICYKKELSKTRCVNGHYVCNECHMQGVDSIFCVCLSETSKAPVEILNKMMKRQLCHMHGPEHHIMVGAALLTAYRNAGGKFDLSKALVEMKNRGQCVPGGVCGFWGACGAGVSSGMFISIISGSTPLTDEPFGLSNRMTAKSLEAIGTVGGPRCCKRDSYFSILSAIDFVKEHFGIEMERSKIVCEFSLQNNQCLGKRCPFSRGNLGSEAYVSLPYYVTKPEL